MKIGKSFSSSLSRFHSGKTETTRKTENHMIRLLHKRQHQQQQQVNDISEKIRKIRRRTKKLFPFSSFVFFLFWEKKVEQRKTHQQSSEWSSLRSQFPSRPLLATEQMGKRALCCSVTCFACHFFFFGEMQLIIDGAQKQSVAFVSAATTANSAGKFSDAAFPKPLPVFGMATGSSGSTKLNWLVNFPLSKHVIASIKHRMTINRSQKLPLTTSNHRAHAHRLSGFSQEQPKGKKTSSLAE